MTAGILVPAPDGSGKPHVTVGPAFVGFAENVVREDARESVQSSAVRVLQAALGAGQGSTGLIVGRVQSGKTLSYEGVISLARDNDFAVVVVISGISNPLLAQGEGRLKRDLTRADSDGWIFLSPAEAQQAPDYVERELERVRDNWSNSTSPKAWRQTAVVVVLKNYSRVRDLAEVFTRVGLAGFRVLVIDDEADQASLNTLARRGRESSTYANLRSLRDALPNHYYLQYTATPQAPLLIAIQDALSPDYVHVLEPGDGYTGGETYFGESNDLIKTIEPGDLAAVSSPGGPPPGALRSAMQEFLVGAAHTAISGGKPETRSMLVHPSRETGDQGTFAAWIRSMKENWQDKLSHASRVEPVRLRSEFLEAWSRLARTHGEIMPFEDCWNALGLVLRNLDITEVNTRIGQTPVINWSPTKFYILIGGQAIDRGFTVEGLTVTYMPRGPGTFTADTIQQRARFFGYKSRYIGLCRVYLEPVVKDAFKMYVDHEREMLKTLSEIQQGTESLKNWKRRFLLDRTMRATRASVIDIPVIHVNTADRWMADRFPVREDALPLASADEGLLRLLGDVNWAPDQTGVHEVGWITLRMALELLEIVSPNSMLAEANFQALSLQLARLGDDDPQGRVVAVFRMRPNLGVGRRLEEPDGGIQLFAGRTQGAGGYPGDRQVYDPHAQVSVQVHRIEVFSRDQNHSRGSFVLTAWRVPETSGTGWIVQVGD